MHLGGCEGSAHFLVSGDGSRKDPVEVCGDAGALEEVKGWLGAFLEGDLGGACLFAGSFWGGGFELAAVDGAVAPALGAVVLFCELEIG
jgi:hypothetical protein